MFLPSWSLSLGLTTTLFLGCNSQSSSSGARGVAEKTGQTVDKALTTTRDTVKDGAGKVATLAEKTGDKIKDGVENVGDKVKGGVEKTGDKVKEGAEKVGDAFEKLGQKVKDATR